MSSFSKIFEPLKINDAYTMKNRATIRIGQPTLRLVTSRRAMIPIIAITIW